MSLTSSKRTQAVILAGGLGTRLRPFTFLMPKPMLPVGAKPIMEHILEWLLENGISDVVVATGYLGRMIQEYFGDGSDRGMRVRYAKSPHPLGTAGQLKSAEGLVGGRFVCVYGDALLKFDLREAMAYHAKKKAQVTMVLMKYSTELKYGFVDTDGEGRLTAWREKPTITGDINVGCYVMEKSFLKYTPRGKTSRMDEAFKEAMKDGARLFAYKAEGEFLDIGDRKSYRDANDQYMKKIGKVL